MESFIGVSEGDFRAVRYNDRGYRDSSLNSSIDLRSFNEGGRTVVEIDIADESVLSGVALELHFDAARLSPVSASFSGLMEADVELASFNQPGVVALGQVDADNTAMLSGGFARVEFEAGPQRAQSAAGDAHSNPVIFAYGEGSSTLSSPASTFQFGNSAVTDSAPADYMFWGAFAGGDGPWRRRHGGGVRRGHGRQPTGAPAPAAAFVAGPRAMLRAHPRPEEHP